MSLRFRRFLFVVLIITTVCVSLFVTIWLYKLIGLIPKDSTYCSTHNTIHETESLLAIFLYTFTWSTPVSVPTLIIFIISCIVHPLLFILNGSRKEFLFITIMKSIRDKWYDFVDWSFTNEKEQNKESIDNDLEEAYIEIYEYLGENNG